MLREASCQSCRAVISFTADVEDQGPSFQRVSTALPPKSGVFFTNVPSTAAPYSRNKSKDSASTRHRGHFRGSVSYTTLYAHTRHTNENCRGCRCCRQDNTMPAREQEYSRWVRWNDRRAIDTALARIQWSAAMIVPPQIRCTTNGRWLCCFCTCGSGTTRPEERELKRTLCCPLRCQCALRGGLSRQHELPAKMFLGLSVSRRGGAVKHRQCVIARFGVI